MKRNGMRRPRPWLAPTVSGEAWGHRPGQLRGSAALTAGRGQDEGRRKPAGSGTLRRPSCPGSTIPSPQIAAMERREATRFPIAREAKHDLCALRRSMPLAFSGARRQRPPRINCAGAMTRVSQWREWGKPIRACCLTIESDQATRAAALSFMPGSAPKGGVSENEAARVPGLRRSVSKARSRASFDALWLRRPGTVPNPECGTAGSAERHDMPPRIRGTAVIMSSIGG